MKDPSQATALFRATMSFRIGLLLLATVLLFMINRNSHAQTVDGIVIDAGAGEPLSGVNIQVQGTTIGTASDTDGRFALDVPSLEVTLLFSFIGFQTEEIALNGRTTLEVEMQPQGIMGDEIVVVGYGTERRADVTGAISTLNARDFNRGPVSSPEQLMQGKLAGVNVTSVSGQPGAPQNVVIRGPGSIRQGSGPLYVIDGIAIDNAANTSPSVNSFGPGSPPSTNPLSFLNPSDIESINVLKDASATAIYGSRASNGVIIITTKSGEADRSRLTYTGSATTSTVANTIDMLSVEEFVEFHNSIGQTDVDQGARSDFFDAIVQNTVATRHALSYSGGLESTEYYASLNYSSQEGLIITNRLQDYGGRLRVEQGAFDQRLTIGVDLLANRQRTDYVPVANDPSTNLGDMLTNSLTQNPTQPIRNPDGSFFEITSDGLNPVQVPDLFLDFGEVTRILGRAEADIQIATGLRATTSFSIDNSQGNRSSQVNPHNNQRIAAPNGAYNFSNRENSMVQVEGTLNYLFSTSDHNIDLLGGYSYQQFESEGRGFSVRDFSTTEIDAFRNPGIGTTVTSSDLPRGFSSMNQLQSFFGRGNYNYNQRYFLTATLRADGSSRFGEANRYGFFPAVSGAWQISDESFAQGLGWLNELKLRVGWGQAGNQDIPNGITQERIRVSQSSGYPIGSDEVVPGITFVRIQNEDIRWEVSTQTNVGVDVALFGNRLSGTVEAFRSQTTDILIETTTGVDPIAATSSFWSNYDMEIINQGVELDLSFQDQLGSGFGFEIGGNLALLDNEVRNMPVDQILTGSISGRGLSGERVQAYRDGLPVGAFWVFDFQGLDENGENVFRDVDGNGSITNADRVFAGSALPDLTYGIAAGASYRGWDLTLNFNGVYGNDIYWNDQNALFNMPQLYAGNNIARVGFNPDESSTNSATASSRFIYNGSYLRLNNATLGYSFFFTDAPISTARVSLTGRNLFTITDYPGFDPEVETPRPSGGFRSFGIDSSRYPSARSLTVTLNLTI